jgi:hypothetical protein
MCLQKWKEGATERSLGSRLGYTSYTAPSSFLLLSSSA